MPEYIKREALEIELNHRLNFLMAENGVYDHYTSGFDEAVTRVENFPSADVEPVRHGRWRKGGYVCGETEFQCSVCNETEWRTSSNRLKYCPNCGAKMDLEGEG